MKILVIGAGGQLGEHLCDLALNRRYEVYGTFKSKPPTDERLKGRIALLDKSNKEQVETLLSRVRPEVVIDTGALHNVDYCETHPAEAMEVNSIGTKNLAQGCGRLGAKFVFVSTDYVFDGTGTPPYREQDEPKPQSAYARSKGEGEINALSGNPNESVVVRPSVIYSWVAPKDTTQLQSSKTSMQSTSSSGKPLNFGAWLVSQLVSKKEVKIVNDQVTSPTLASDLAAAILAIVSSSEVGIFHTAGSTALSRFDFSVLLARKLMLDSSLIHPISTEDLKQTAKRPSNSSLHSDRIKKEVGYHMMEIDNALISFAKEARNVRVTNP